MFLNLLRRDVMAGKVLSRKTKCEKVLNYGMISLGVLAAACGGTVTVLDSFFPYLLA